MSFWSIWDSFRPIESVVIAVTVMLTFSAVERTRTLSAGTNKRLLAANWAVVLALVLSLKPIYHMVDPLLGGHNFTNLIQRILIAYAGFAVTYSLAQMTRRVFQEERCPGCSEKIWLLLSIVVMGASFIWMGAVEATSRGLEGYAGNYLAYTLYQISTFTSLLVGGSYLVPRLWNIARDSDDRQMKMQLNSFILSYCSAFAALFLFILTPLSPVVVGFREFFIYLTMAALALGFMLINHERRSLISKRGKPLPA